MKRKDTFFGLHFDYHANESTKNIGKDFDESVLKKIIEEVKPDFIQCDTKGHPGLSSYTTKVGNTAPGLVNELLPMWRKVTKEHDTLLFSHYSGIWDKEAMKSHPEWASVSKNGDYSDRASVFGNYAQELLIPQLKELASEIGMNGAWVDGECWALIYDYSEHAAKAWKEKTGKKLADIKDEDMKEYRAFLRRSFLSYVENYIKEVKKTYPDFEITSNWLNTSWVPDNVTFTDYISGDLAPTNSVDSARFDGRIMQSFGRNWDIMSWGISYPVHHMKSAAQLSQEAASIISLGGGFQIYNMQSPDKTVMDEWAIPIWADVARFCRERQPYCQNTKQIPDIGVIYSPLAYYDKLERLFFRDCDYNMEVNGMVGALCDLGHSVSVIHTERIDEIKLDEYKSIVVTNSTVLESGVKEKLLDYAKNGGTLIVSGVDTVGLFKDELSLSVSNVPEVPIVFLSGDFTSELRTPYVKISTSAKCNTLTMRECRVEGDLKCENPPPTIVPSNVMIPAMLEMANGKGNVKILPINLGRLYYNENTFELKKFFKNVFSNIPSRVSHDMSGAVDVTLNEKNGKEYINLVNLLGEHRCERIKTFDYIPKVHGLTVKYKTDRAPISLTERPSGKNVDFIYEGGEVLFKTDIEIYTIIELEYEN